MYSNRGERVPDLVLLRYAASLAAAGLADPDVLSKAQPESVALLHMAAAAAEEADPDACQTDPVIKRRTMQIASDVHTAIDSIRSSAGGASCGGEAVGTSGQSLDLLRQAAEAAEAAVKSAAASIVTESPRTVLKAATTPPITARLAAYVAASGSAEAVRAAGQAAAMRAAEVAAAARAAAKAAAAAPAAASNSSSSDVPNSGSGAASCSSSAAVTSSSSNSSSSSTSTDTTEHRLAIAAARFASRAAAAASLAEKRSAMEYQRSIAPKPRTLSPGRGPSTGRSNTQSTGHTPHSSRAQSSSRYPESQTATSSTVAAKAAAVLQQSTGHSTSVSPIRSSSRVNSAREMQQTLSTASSSRQRQRPEAGSLRDMTAATTAGTAAVAAAAAVVRGREAGGFCNNSTIPCRTSQDRPQLRSSNSSIIQHRRLERAAPLLPELLQHVEVSGTLSEVAAAAAAAAQSASKQAVTAIAGNKHAAKPPAVAAAAADAVLPAAGKVPERMAATPAAAETLDSSKHALGLPSVLSYESNVGSQGNQSAPTALATITLDGFFRSDGSSTNSSRVCSLAGQESASVGGWLPPPQPPPQQQQQQDQQQQQQQQQQEECSQTKQPPQQTERRCAAPDATVGVVKVHQHQCHHHQQQQHESVVRLLQDQEQPHKQQQQQQHASCVRLQQDQEHPHKQQQQQQQSLAPERAPAGLPRLSLAGQGNSEVQKQNEVCPSDDLPRGISLMDPVIPELACKVHKAAQQVSAVQEHQQGGSSAHRGNPQQQQAQQQQRRQQQQQQPNGSQQCADSSRASTSWVQTLVAQQTETTSLQQKQRPAAAAAATASGRATADVAAAPTTPAAAAAAEPQHCHGQLTCDSSSCVGSALPPSRQRRQQPLQQLQQMRLQRVAALAAHMKEAQQQQEQQPPAPQQQQQQQQQPPNQKHKPRVMFQEPVMNVQHAHGSQDSGLTLNPELSCEREPASPDGWSIPSIMNSTADSSENCGPAFLNAMRIKVHGVNSPAGDEKSGVKKKAMVSLSGLASRVTGRQASEGGAAAALVVATRPVMAGSASEAHSELLLGKSSKSSGHVTSGPASDQVPLASAAKLHRSSSSSEGDSSSSDSSDGSAAKDSSSKDRGRRDIFKLRASRFWQRTSKHKFLLCVLLPLLLATVLVGGGVGAWAWVKKHRGDDVAGTGQPLAFQVTMQVPKKQPQSCEAWFGSTEQLEDYRLTFADAYAKALNLPVGDFNVGSVICGGRTMTGTGSSSSSRGSGSGSSSVAAPSRLLLAAPPASGATSDTDILESIQAAAAALLAARAGKPHAGIAATPATVKTSAPKVSLAPAGSAAAPPTVDIKTRFTITGASSLAANSAQRERVAQTVEANSQDILEEAVADFFGVKSLTVTKAGKVDGAFQDQPDRQDRSQDQPGSDASGPGEPSPFDTHVAMQRPQAEVSRAAAAAAVAAATAAAAAAAAKAPPFTALPPKQVQQPPPVHATTHYHVTYPGGQMQPSGGMAAMRQAAPAAAAPAAPAANGNLADQHLRKSAPAVEPAAAPAAATPTAEASPSPDVAFAFDSWPAVWPSPSPAGTDMSDGSSSSSSLKDAPAPPATSSSELGKSADSSKHGTSGGSSSSSRKNPSAKHHHTSKAPSPPPMKKPYPDAKPVAVHSVVSTGADNKPITNIWLSWQAKKTPAQQVATFQIQGQRPGQPPDTDAERLNDAAAAAEAAEAGGGQPHQGLEEGSLLPQAHQPDLQRGPAAQAVAKVLQQQQQQQLAAAGDGVQVISADTSQTDAQDTQSPAAAAVAAAPPPPAGTGAAVPAAQAAGDPASIYAPAGTLGSNSGRDHEQQVHTLSGLRTSDSSVSSSSSSGSSHEPSSEPPDPSLEEPLPDVFPADLLDPGRYSTAATCRFAPSSSNSVSDAQGRLWGWMKGTSCLFRKPYISKQGLNPSKPSGVTYDNAPLCKGTPNGETSLTDDKGHLWGWQDARSCVYRGAQPSVVRKGQLPIERMPMLWEDAPTCSDYPTVENTMPDAFGRLWGEDNGQTCAFKV